MEATGAAAIAELHPVDAPRVRIDEITVIDDVSIIDDVSSGVMDNLDAGRDTFRGSRTAKATMMVADLCTVAVAMCVAALLGSMFENDGHGMSPASVAFAGIVASPLWLGLFARYKLYSASAVSSRLAESNRIVHAAAAASASTALLAVLLGWNISRTWLVLTFVMVIPALLVEREVARRLFARARANGRLGRRVLIVGTNAEARGLCEMLACNRSLGYSVIGYVGNDLHAGIPNPPLPVLGGFDDTLAVLEREQATGAIIAMSAIEAATANALARELMDKGFHVELTSGLVDIAADRLIARPLGRRPVLYVEPVRRVGWRVGAKRLFDIVVAGTLLLLALPVLAVCAVLVKLDSRGPVLFRQVRLGKDGTPFPLVKLRTMVVGAEQMIDELQHGNEADGPLFKLRDDPRVTRVGRFLRKTSLDELPQLWNVLRGEMSIVGPRPALERETEGWTPALALRLRVKPGITGMWQVNGRSASSFEDYTRHDLYYVHNWSLLTDLAIVMKTIPVVLFRRGAY
jgi:exopolysaccharide biosynthesis polyprenyl glycosylphosphotransferase